MYAIPTTASLVVSIFEAAEMTGLATPCSVSPLRAPDECALSTLADRLQQNGIDHKVWIEQPENIATCIALRPYLKEHQVIQSVAAEEDFSAGLGGSERLCCLSVYPRSQAGSGKGLRPPS
ncbi:hypothetical protein Chor_006100 [Crotalus horridus]